MAKTGPAAGGPGTRPADSVSRLIAGPLLEAGFDLEAVDVRRAGNRHVVAVAVDRDGGLDMDAVTAASRVVSGVLDEDKALPPQLRGAYTLEVSSRGVDAPLTAPRHWRRARTRLVEVRRRSGAPVVGRISAADDDGVDLDVQGEALRLLYSDVTRALVQLEFSRPPGLDAPGDLDELEDEFDGPTTASDDSDDETGDADERDEPDGSDGSDASDSTGVGEFNVPWDNEVSGERGQEVTT